MGFNTIFSKGEVINNRYEIIEDGQQGAGSIYGVGKDRTTGRKVFLKKYNDPTNMCDWFNDYVNYQKELKARIDKTSAKQCVYELYDFFVDSDDWYWQVIEYIEGGKDLDKYLQESTTTWAQRKTFASVFMYAMDILHSQCKMVHADLKPANLLLIPHGDSFNIKLIDLDRPVFTDYVIIPWEKDEGHLGSQGYFSPEHLRQERPTPKSDIFTCGIILWELLTKNGHPYGLEDACLAKYEAYSSVPVPELISSFGSEDKDNEVARMLRKMLDPNPNNRPTAKEVQQCLIATPTGPQVTIEEIPIEPTLKTEDVRKMSGMADIVFLVDVTGSMKPCIDALTTNIREFINQMVNGDPKHGIVAVRDWRARVVGYRDYDYDHTEDRYGGWLVDNPFTRSQDELVSQLSGLRPKGGGPEPPESLLDAIMTVAQVGTLPPTDGGNHPVAERDSRKWRQQGVARIVVVFTDAGFHEQMSIPGYRGSGANDLHHVVKQKRIVLYMFVPALELYDKTLARFPKAVIFDCGSGADGLRATIANRENFSKLLDLLCKGISVSSSSMLEFPM